MVYVMNAFPLEISIIKIKDKPWITYELKKHVKGKKVICYVSPKKDVEERHKTFRNK